jgi:hypothetical protein
MYKCNTCEKQYKTQSWLKKHELKCSFKETKCNCDDSVELVKIKQAMNDLLNINNVMCLNLEIIFAELAVHNNLMLSKVINERVIMKDYLEYINIAAIKCCREPQEQFYKKEVPQIYKTIAVAKMIKTQIITNDLTANKLLE